MEQKDIENIIYTKGIQLSTIFSKAVFYYMTLAKYQIYDNIFANNKREQTYYLIRDMLLEYLPITKINDNETYNAYSTDNFADEEALLTALKADLTKAATALYVVPGVDSDLADASAKAVPEIVKSAPQSGIYGRITKFYTIPNGGIGVKYQIIRV